MKFVLMVLFLLFSNVTYASYEKTTWGMALSKVKILYPGGIAKNQQNGELTYEVVRPVGGLSSAYLTFTFNASGLRKVSILFPKQGVDVDLKSGAFIEMDYHECLVTFALMKDRLTAKYGPPAGTKDKTASWTTSSGEQVFLSMISSDNIKATLGLSYTPPEAVKSLSNGL